MIAVAKGDIVEDELYEQVDDIISEGGGRREIKRRIKEMNLSASSTSQLIVYAIDQLNEDLLYGAQSSWIRRHYGEEAAENANYGWGVSGAGKGAVVETKVYGQGVLISHMEGRRIVHEFE